MANPICLSPLKFYDSLNKQERYKSYAYGHISPLIMPLGSLLPFQFMLEYDEVYQERDMIIDADLCDASTNSVVQDIMPQLRDAGLTYVDKGPYRISIFPGVLALTGIRLEGEYYLKLYTNVGLEYYSEIFCFTSSLDDCLEIEYWNPETDFWLNGGVVTFDSGFRFKLYLKSELGKPEYTFEEEATKRLGYNFVESQVSKKTYKFNTIIPEFICDALRLVRLCSRKILRSKGEEYKMLTFDMDVNWQDQGDLASVDCEFDVDNIIVNIGGFEYEKPVGDFNNDFNNDFSNRSSN